MLDCWARLKSRVLHFDVVGSDRNLGKIVNAVGVGRGGPRRAAIDVGGRDFRLRNRRARRVRYFSGDRRHYLLAVRRLRRHKRDQKQQSRCDQNLMAVT